MDLRENLIMFCCIYAKVEKILEGSYRNKNYKSEV